ncbi:MAG: PHP domain-containing protein [Planctomycetota bacterium]|nr:PHP domain-containing protein [Planctomycetota bacterium]
MIHDFGVGDELDFIHIDLHLHSTASDGRYPPQEVVDRAVAAGIQIISLTDHDTIKGYEEVKDYAAGKIFLVPGTEVTTYYDGIEFHFLAYFPNGIGESCRLLLKSLQDERMSRMKLCLFNLRKRGLKIGYQDVAQFVDGSSVSRSHIARALVAGGYAANIYEAFAKFLSPEAGLIPPPSLSPLRLFDLLSKDGAFSFWAHPEQSDFDKYFALFKEKGLSGVEICSKSRFPLYFEKTALSNGLLTTFGSDWHGFNEEEAMGVRINPERVKPFLSLFKEQNFI